MCVLNCWGNIIFFVSFSRGQVAELGDSEEKLARLSAEKFLFYRIRIVSSGRLAANIVAGYNSNLISLNILLYTAQCRPCLNVVLCGLCDFKIDYILYIYTCVYVCVCGWFHVHICV